jgi:hypothetical protein
MTLRIKTFSTLVFAAAAAAAWAQSDRSQLANVPVEQLKIAYLDCDRKASRAVLDFGSARACSLTAEELLQRGFAGNFDRLLAWWRSEVQRAEQAVTDPPEPPRATSRPAV